MPAGLSITDMMAGAHLAQGILALLVRRGVTGEGGRADVSLIETAIDLQFEHLAVYLNRRGDMPGRSDVANANLYLAAPYGIYGTADGYIAIAMAPVDRLGALINCEALAAFPSAQWFTRRDAIKALLRDHLRGGTTTHWLSLLEPAGIWAAPVQDWPTLTREPGFAALDAVQQVRSADGATLALTRCPIRVDGQIIRNDRAAPRLGADSAAIQSELTGAA